MAWNWGSAFGGGLTGAAAGAGLGTIAFPGVGTAAGGLLGGAAGFFAGGASGGSEAKYNQVPNKTPSQIAVMDKLLQQGSANYNPEAIAQRARSQFNQVTVPGLAERFTSMGQGRLSSPVFASQVGQAGASLEEAIAALNSQNALNQLQLGLGQQFDTHYQPRQASGYEELMKQLLPVAGQLGGAYLGAQGNLQGIDKIIAQLNRK